MTNTKSDPTQVRILALDTATSIVSVALAHGNTIDVKINRETNRHTESLIPMVDALMQEAGLTVKDLDAVAFGAGPGAFTGLRAACGTAQGLAWAADIPVIAVGNLEGGASLLQNQGMYGRILVANDARMNESYVAIFDVTKDAIVEVKAPSLVSPSMLNEMLQTCGATHLIGSALDVYQDQIYLPDDSIVLLGSDITAKDIARVALDKWRKKEVTTPQLAAPLYVRNRVALTIDERKAGEKL